MSFLLSLSLWWWSKVWAVVPIPPPRPPPPDIPAKQQKLQQELGHGALDLHELAAASELKLLTRGAREASGEEGGIKDVAAFSHLEVSCD